jgi:adenylate cyclase
LLSFLRRTPPERGWETVVAHEEERFRLQKALGQYLPRDVAESIARGDAPPAARRTEVTVLFCDRRGFTFLCERERAEDVADLLNVFFERATAIVEGHGGSINKLLGDGLLALYGAVGPLPAHADAAADSALELLDWVRDLRERGGVWTHLAVGIGIDTGEVVLGPIGSATRREYTAIGSPVNRAARLQALAEREHQRVIVSEGTRRALARRHRPASLGVVSLKGFATPEQVYFLSPRKGAVESDTFGRVLPAELEHTSTSSSIRVTPVTQVTGLARLEDLTSEVTPGTPKSGALHIDPITHVSREITMPTDEHPVEPDATRLEVRAPRHEDSGATREIPRLPGDEDTRRQAPAPRAPSRR